MPRPKSITLFHVNVPLKSRIKHASHERSTSENLIVRVELDDGSIGYGEGVPRSYVTGETLETTFQALQKVDLSAVLGGNPTTFGAVCDRLRDWSLPEIQNDPRGMFGNAARCALELAVLDAYGRSFHVAVGEAICRETSVPALLRNPPGRVRYSGAITASSARKELISAIKMRAYGFAHVKLKVGVEGQDDPTRLRKLRRILGSRVDLRIDANEAWTLAELKDRVAPLRPFGISALEQPVAHAEVDGLAEVRPQLGIPVMLDESLCGEPDGRRAIDLGLADIFNIRLSKCGGIFPSLKLLALANSAGLRAKLGCHPGETGILSAAGRQFASRLQGFVAVEGSYDRHVLSKNVLKAGQDLTFRYGGWARPLSGDGLGIEVDPEAIDALTIRRLEIRHD